MGTEVYIIKVSKAFPIQGPLSQELKSKFEKGAPLRQGDT